MHNSITLTPFELAQAQHADNSHMIGLITDTMLLIEGLQAAQASDPAMLPTLERLADEAIVALAQEMKTRHGVSA